MRSHTSHRAACASAHAKVGFTNAKASEHNPGRKGRKEGANSAARACLNSTCRIQFHGIRMRIVRPEWCGAAITSHVSPHLSQPNTPSDPFPKGQTLTGSTKRTRTTFLLRASIHLSTYPLTISSCRDARHLFYMHLQSHLKCSPGPESRRI